MRLLDLDPHWAVTADGRHGMGITFLCPHCLHTRLAVMFANPVDGGPAASDKWLWQRTGETFDVMTLSPSVNASTVTEKWNHLGITGHWHGFITNGDIA